MSGQNLHLLQVKVRPHAYIKDVISGCWRYVQDGIKEKGSIIHGFKIVGENRMIFLLDDGVDGALDAMNTAYGEQIDLLCTPLRSYETFAEHVLGVDKALTANSPKISGNGRIYWLQFDIEYKDMKIADFLSIWKSEAVTMLSLRNNESSKIELELYKVVGQRQVHIFIKLPGGDLVDDMIFTLPLSKEMGNQVQITTKSLVMLQ